MLTCKTSPSNVSAGAISVPGDKSISHRAVIFACLGVGPSIIHNYLQSDDVTATVKAFKQMGVSIKNSNYNLLINGSGLRALKKPLGSIDCGNSGTTCRLLTGLLSAQAFDSCLIGDHSLSKRPMERVIRPLTAMGASIKAKSGFLPLLIEGNKRLKGKSVDIMVPSAQVFTAIVLASFYSSDSTIIKHGGNFRNHTQKLMSYLGLPYKETQDCFIVYPLTSYTNKDIYVPSDFSSAAFFLLLGILSADDGLKISNVLINPSRTGLLNLLRKMGAIIEVQTSKESLYHEETADITVYKSNLIGTTLDGELVQNAIDEVPVLAIAAAFASGQTIIKNAQELRIKESDRISSMVNNLKLCGIDCSELEDGMVINGGIMNDASVDSYDDHRIAMSFIIAGLASDATLQVKSCEIINTSFPGFFDVLTKLACNYILIND